MTISPTSKALLTVVTAFAGNELRRFISNLDVDDVLRPLGLRKRESRLGESFLLVGVGMILGGGAAAILASTSRHDLSEWFFKKKETTDEGGEKNTNSEEAAAPSSGESEAAHHCKSPLEASLEA